MKLQALDGELITVKFWHDLTPRELKTEHRGQTIINQIVGETNCLIEREDGPSFLATAHCSASDQFSKAKGRKVALSRAMRTANFDKAQRTHLWAEYFKVVAG